MAKLYETLSLARQLEVAVRTNSPESLARTFASYEGQFYDRGGFDRLAREVSELYAAESPSRADAFRARLDDRLCDRDCAPVVWHASVERAA